LIYIGNQVIEQLIGYLAQQQLQRLALVADSHTYAALGQRVETALRSAGFDVQLILIGGDEIIVDEMQVVEVMLRNDNRQRAFLAVGSGTITDIARFVTLQTGGAFISLPTAPSVDAYTSPITPMVIRQLKITAPGHLPQAIFADLDTLCKAPQRMIAAGVGDTIAKWTSTADWKLGGLLWGDRFDEAIARRFNTARQQVVDAAPSIGNALPEGIRALTEGLIECGLCMADYGTSLPAAGSEHLLSHFWEGRLLYEHRPALLHGAKVGVGTVLAAGYWQQVRGMTRAEAQQRLAKSPLPDREQEIARIRTGFPMAVPQVIEAQSRYLSMSEADYEAFKASILAHWDEIQAISAEVAPLETVAAVLRQVHGPTTALEAGLQERDLVDGLEYAYLQRNRFPILRLRRMLGI
jgi:glycerol-1-phosphate dehydrogenase [NAD(P)+]